MRIAWIVFMCLIWTIALLADESTCTQGDASLAYTPTQIITCCDTTAQDANNKMALDRNLLGCCDPKNFQVLRDASATPPAYLATCCDQTHIGLNNNGNTCCTFYSQIRAAYPDAWLAQNPQQCAPLLCSSSAFATSYPALCATLRKTAH